MSPLEIVVAAAVVAVAFLLFVGTVLGFIDWSDR